MSFIDPFGIIANDPFFRDALRDPFFNRFVDRPSLESNPQQQASAVTPHNQLGQLSKMIRTPRLDLKETENHYMIQADVPGLKKEDIHLSVHDNMLTMEGERKDEKEEKIETRHLIERSFGKFSRSIRLPLDANPDTCKAKIEHGVLNLTFEKKQETEPPRKRIEIS